MIIMKLRLIPSILVLVNLVHYVIKYNLITHFGLLYYYNYQYDNIILIDI